MGASQSAQHLSASPLTLKIDRSIQKDHLSVTEAVHKKCRVLLLHRGVNGREPEQMRVREGQVCTGVRLCTETNGVSSCRIERKRQTAFTVCH